jgi:hypothetical protein
MARGNLDVLQFGRIGQGEVEVTRRFIAAPRNEVEPVALIQAREPQRVPYLLNFLRIQHANLHRQVVVVEQHGAGSTGERAAWKRQHVTPATRPFAGRGQSSLSTISS